MRDGPVGEPQGSDGQAGQGIGTAGKATVVAPANIAFVKYWGAHDLGAVRPVNQSISMTLREAVTRTTVEVVAAGQADELLLADEGGRLAAAHGTFRDRALAHAERVRRELGLAGALRIATRNSFPTGAGIASSASGFTALTLAIRAAFGAPGIDTRELSRQVRRSGSGSAARSVVGGYVEWPTDVDDPDPAASQIAAADHWALCDVIAIVGEESKEVSSRTGHRRAATSPHFERRLELVGDRLHRVREAIRACDLDALGPAIEEEAIELHLIAMSSQPPIYYWNPATLAVLEAARELRRAGVAVWATIDAGPNVHLICEPAGEPDIAAAAAAVPGVTRVLRDAVGRGPRGSDRHLF